jgi:hypothetical protein
MKQYNGDARKCKVGNNNNTTDSTHLTLRIVACLSELNNYHCAVFWKRK